MKRVKNSRDQGRTQAYDGYLDTESLNVGDTISMYPLEWMAPSDFVDMRVVGRIGARIVVEITKSTRQDFKVGKIMSWYPEREEDSLVDF